MLDAGLDLVLREAHAAYPRFIDSTLFQGKFSSFVEFACFFATQIQTHTAEIQIGVSFIARLLRGHVVWIEIT